MKPDAYIAWLPPQFEVVDRFGSRGQLGALRVGELTVPLVRSLDIDDAVLAPGLYVVVMEFFATKKQRDGTPRRSLMFRKRWDDTKRDWGPDFAHRGLAVHTFGRRSDGSEIPIFPRGLDGCAGPGMMFRPDGVALSETAWDRIISALGGWKRWAEFRVQILP